MGAHLELEVDTGDVLQLIRQDGTFGGKALYDLAGLYSNYTQMFQFGSWEFEWFRKLDELTEKDPGLINKIMYAGNWNYDEEEHDGFLVCECPGQEISKEDFVRIVREVANLWTPVDKVIEVVSELVEVLPKMGTETDWFSPRDTLEDFQGLLVTLVLAKARRGENVRLRGS